MTSAKRPTYRRVFSTIASQRSGSWFATSSRSKVTATCSRCANVTLRQTDKTTTVSDVSPQTTHVLHQQQQLTKNSAPSAAEQENLVLFNAETEQKQQNY